MKTVRHSVCRIWICKDWRIGNFTGTVSTVRPIQPQLLGTTSSKELLMVLIRVMFHPTLCNLISGATQCHKSFSVRGSDWCSILDVIANVSTRFQRFLYQLYTIWKDDCTVYRLAFYHVMYGKPYGKGHVRRIIKEKLKVLKQQDDRINTRERNESCNNYQMY